MIRLDDEDLWSVADTIVVGQVPLPPQPFVQAGSKAVFSKTTILIDEYVWASPQQKEIRQIELVHPGGSYQGRTTVAPGMPMFRQHERVLLFLRRDRKTGRYNIVGLSQGKFEIRREEGTDREYLVPSVGKVDLMPALSGEKPTTLKAAAPSGEDALGEQPRRYLDEAVRQVKAYKRLKSGVEQ